MRSCGATSLLASKQYSAEFQGERSEGGPGIAHLPVGVWADGSQAGRTKAWGSPRVAVQHRLEVSYESTPVGTQRWGKDGAVSAHLDLQGI